MDPSLDPRLQPSPNETTDKPFEQPRPHSYPDPSNDHVSPVNKHHTILPPPPGATPKAQQPQQYYGAPTPSSSSYHPETSGSGQTYPYDNGAQPYDMTSAPSYGAPLPTAAEVAADLKRPRACEACRQLKVKCEPEEMVSNACRRCFRSGRQCVITMPSRKRQKKTDSRVAELEKKIDALTASLHAQQGQGQIQANDSSDVSPEPYGTTSTPVYDSPHVGQWIPPRLSRENLGGGNFPVSSPPATVGVKRKMSGDYGPSMSGNETPLPPPSKNKGSGYGGYVMSIADQKPASKANDEDLDVIDRNVMDIKSAYECFDRYVNVMAPIHPFVTFPPGTTAEAVRKEKPVLFLAILAVASNAIRPDVHQALVTEVMSLYADRVIVRGEKKMELVQAIIVTTIWYTTPLRYEELNFNQLIHMAAVLAIDLGMGKRMKSSHLPMYKEYYQKKAFGGSPNPQAAETRRTWLACYYMCANASMSLRRPLLMRWTGYMDDSLEILETSPDALSSDKWLVCLIRGQRIAEDVGFQFSMDDPTVEVSITDPKTQYHLKAFERQFSEWKSRTPKEMQNVIFNHASNILSLYLHEVAMHHDHNIDDFKPPYSVQPEAGSPEPGDITPAHIDSLTICIQSIHGAFDALLAMDMETVRSLPTITFVRTSYAAVALIKLSSAIKGSKRRFGDVFNAEDLKAEYYLDAVVKRLRSAGEGDRCRVAGKFSIIFGMLRSWYNKILETEAKTRAESGGESENVSARGAIGQMSTQQDPASSQWSAAPGPKAMDDNTRQSGLHMLSELASNSNHPAPDTSAADIPPMTTSAANWPQQYDAPSVFAGDLSNGTVTGVDMDMMGFDFGDLDALSFAVNDPTWLNTSYEPTTSWLSM